MKVARPSTEPRTLFPAELEHGSLPLADKRSKSSSRTAESFGGHALDEEGYEVQFLIITEPAEKDFHPITSEESLSQQQSTLPSPPGPETRSPSLAQPKQAPNT